MASISVKVDTKKLDALLNGTGPMAEKVIEVAARNIEASWKQNITDQKAVDTGAYRAGVEVKPNHKPFERIIGDSVDYGIYVEFGTHRAGGASVGESAVFSGLSYGISRNGMAARPCAKPAFEAERQPFLRAWREMLK
jgi:hypothetical protein